VVLLLTHSFRRRTPVLFYKQEGVPMVKKNQIRGVTTAPNAKGYSEAGASLTKRSMKGFTASSGSPNEDINWNNMTLRQRSRVLYMSSPVAAAAINTTRTKVVGVGLSLQSTIDRSLLGLTEESARAWQRKTEAEFALWASKKRACDAIGMNDFQGMQQLALKSWLMNGDVFAVVKHKEGIPESPYSLRIHLVEADRIRTPTINGTLPGLSEGVNKDNGNAIYDGVEVDSSGMVVAYYIHNNYPHELTKKQEKPARVLAYGNNTGLPNILHVTDSERADQYRGVPYLAPVIETLLQLRRYTESELMAALVQSFFSAWIVTKTDPANMPFNEVGDGLADVPGENPSGGVSENDHEYEMGPGQINVLAEGEDVQFGNPNIPTSGFDVFVKTICREIGAALELPYDVLIKEFNSSYSASRGALLEAWEAFKMRREWFVNSFCQPIYEIWLAEAISRGRINAPGFFTDPLIRAAYARAEWIGPTQGQLDPLKEAKAAILLTSKGIKTHAQVTREIGGGDWEANAEQVVHEMQVLNSAGAAPQDIEIDADDPEEGSKGDE